MTQSNSGPVLLITGGAGFLGRAILECLKRSDFGFSEIRIFDVREPEYDFAPHRSVVGDIRSHEQLSDACRDVDVVIHAASLVDYGHAGIELLNEINIDGTQNVIRACREQGVRALVYTSTMDVVVGSGPIRDGDEDIPYPARFGDAYAASKARAEEIVLASNDDRLRTCVIRPCGMFGEADPYHVSNVLRSAMAGKLTARVGNGDAIFQHVYVGNVAHAHLLAARQLIESETRIAGRVYFITDTPAVNFFDFLEPIINQLGYSLPPRSRYLPYGVAYTLGMLFEGAARLLRPVYSFKPLITRSSVQILCEDISFTGERARKELGYEPVYSHSQSIERTVDWFREHGPIPEPGARSL